MTPQQVAGIAIVAAMFSLFVWDRWRYDLVAAATLVAGVAAGVVPPDKAFAGFSDPVIVVIASVLVIGKAIARSGALDPAVGFLLRRAGATSARVAVLTTCVAFLSAFVKNVGTLAIFMPIAIRAARRANTSPSLYLMPLSFASLIGGSMTLVGTSPNLLISSVRAKELGGPFGIFDFAWVGLPLTCAALAFLSFGWRLLPRDRAPGAQDESKFDVGDYTTELRVVEGSTAAGKTVGDVEDLVEGNLIVVAILRDGARQNIPSRRRPVTPGDVLVVRASPEAVRGAVDKAGFELEGSGKLEPGRGSDSELESVEAIVGGDFILVGETAGNLRMRHRYDVNLLAVSRGGRSVASSLRAHIFAAGDVVVLQGFAKAMASTLSELGCLPLADRNIGIGKRRHASVSLVILAAAIVAIVARAAPVEVCFFAAAVLIALTGQTTLKTAYAAIEGPVLLMLASLISFAEGLKETGVIDLLGARVAGAAVQLPSSLAVGLILLVTMIVTPMLHHAPAVLILGPMAAAVAKNMNMNADPFLLAVALGAASDFLTPIGHQNNLLVMGPGGYRFDDYWRLGLPLSVLVLVAGTALIVFFWPV